MEIDASLVSGATLDANQNSRVVQIEPNTNVTLRNLTITNGNPGTAGGQFDNSGGGVVAVDASLALINSSVTDSVVDSAFGGGGIYVDNNGFLHLEGSTVSGNTAGVTSGDNGGGIYLDSGAGVSIINSTISGNFATGTGGGFDRFGNGTELEFLNATFANNNATEAGSQIHLGGSVGSIRNSIIAGDNGLCDANGPSIENVYIDSFTIIQDGSCDAAGKGARIVDPGLENLANNGGPTRTHALKSNNEARDSGDNHNCPYTDQRGQPRDDGECDVGAFEFGSGDGGGFNIIPLGNGKVVVVPM